MEGRLYIIPLLNELHWLPVKFHCEYKITTLSYCHFNGTLPSYFSASLCTYETSRTLWSSSEKLLKIPKHSLKSVGDRSFSFITLSVWHSLPASLWNLPTLSASKPSSKLSFFNRHFHKSRWTMMCVYRLCLCLCVYLREWCVLAHWVFLTKKFALYKSHSLSSSTKRSINRRKRSINRIDRSISNN